MEFELTPHDALFLDLDGTVIDIAPSPDGVTIPKNLVADLDRLLGCLRGGLAIVTGRPISDVDRLLAPMAPVAAGSHGSELRSLPHGEIAPLATPIDAAFVKVVRRVAEAHAGVLVELKQAAIAVHYRQAPALAARLEAALTHVLNDGPDHLILTHGRYVLEIVPRQHTKGTALEAIMCLPVFVGRRPIMIGDDITDLSAFAAATRLGGRGLKVAGERFTTAESDFAHPAAVRGWLAAMAERTSNL